MSTLDFTPVADDEQFERLLADLLSEKYGVKFQLWGRSGQAQGGIDIAGQLPDGQWLLVQAKNRKASHDFLGGASIKAATPQGLVEIPRIKGR